MDGQRAIEIASEDKLSGLHDYVLLHIMGFLRTKHAVRTSVLSKRWEHLWKSLASFKLDSSNFQNVVQFREFLSSFMSHRDGSLSLENVAFRHPGHIGGEILNSFIEYIVSRGIQKLTLDTKFEKLPPCIFSCQSLTFLKISSPSTPFKKTIIPESLGFPALKTLHLDGVIFSTSGNGYPEPFSTCQMLNTLVVEDCFVGGLYICNSMLTSLTIVDANSLDLQTHYDKIVLCTPRLSSLNTNGYLVYEISSNCNLLYLKDVKFNVTCSFRDLPRKSLVLVSWMKVLANVTTMTLSSYTIEMLNVLLFRRSTRNSLPCFSRLDLLKVNLGPNSKITSDKDVLRIVGYLLQYSPSTKVDIIRRA
ncbi:hypothetical protein TanjilG_27491 [Lupinus angustifolius]|uniref:Uncharacterized protein n=1 Tax=Lupinus angustifolius TaxID=3871 RepID=A0A4P1R3T5_LUPAN|nr:PREDICTED: F-box/LRR-repeat protein At4g14103-like [Lupinus angustifolius]XP_019462866.1 PREDICTED: F-box/LRR-repeat protein At4g14103-like [Lupinus angustifolius]OIW00240.1 hypothetical protein TanjilG_27491 [Lupinus angustifolius]